MFKGPNGIMVLGGCGILLEIIFQNGDWSSYWSTSAQVFSGFPKPLPPCI